MPVCAAIAVAAAGDPQLVEAFGRLREFDSKLTNQPVYVDPDLMPAPPERCVSCAELFALLPPGTRPADALAPESLAALKTAARERFGERAGFALVAYGQSKEYDLLFRALVSGGWSDGGETMPLVVAAVRSGRLRLEPRPDSGWYDYQWHALETLLVPERAPECAPEAPKLLLTAAYRERLENAFKAQLTKNRETHIKHLPVINLIETLHDGRVPPEVQVAPEFCVEPTATVYLRSARGYRFLRNAMRGVLGEATLSRLHSGAGGPDLDEELRRMTLLCYGLHEQLCLEIGRSPDYLDGEMTPEDRAAARSEAADWFSVLDRDPDLAADTRVAAPISGWPGGPVRHWATGGVKLEIARYSYCELPRVFGEVKPVFVPAVRYLPTDVFLEFESPGKEALTREEFRALCAGCPDEDSLRARLKAAPARRHGWEFPWKPAAALALLAAAAVVGWRFRARLADRWARRPKRLLLKTTLAAAAALALFALALALSPGLRTRLLVKWLAPINDPVGMAIEYWYLDHPSTASADCLADLMADPDPQTRYLAARFLEPMVLCQWEPEWEERESMVEDQRGPKWEEWNRCIQGMKARLQAAVRDEVPDVAAVALRLLGNYHDEQNVTFLLARLEEVRGVDQLCESTLWSLRCTNSPRVLDAVLPFACDPRRMVCWAAFSVLGTHLEERVALALAEIIRSGNKYSQSMALMAVQSLVERTPDFKTILDPALLEVARAGSFEPDYRMELAGCIASPTMKAEALLAIFQGPKSPEYSESVRSHAASALAELCPGKRLTVERLDELTGDPDVDLTALAATLLKPGDDVPGPRP